VLTHAVLMAVPITIAVAVGFDLVWRTTTGARRCRWATT
jgi:hypothetical protein